MPRADKQATVAELTEAFRSASAALLTEYRGLTVAQLAELRESLRGKARYAVVKNTLTKIAAREAGLADIEPLLVGPSAIAFVTGDPVEVAKGLRDFARTYPPLVVKGGVFEGRTLSADEVRRLADLESREVLLAKLAGAMKASLQQAVSTFAAPLSQFARLAAALHAKAEADPSLPGGAATPEPPADQAATPAPATEAAEPAAAEAAEPPGDEAATSEPPAAEAAEPATEETPDQTDSDS